MVEDAIAVWNDGTGAAIFETQTTHPTVTRDMTGRVTAINSADCAETADDGAYVASVVVIELPSQLLGRYGEGVQRVVL